MLESMRFVKGAVARKDFVPALVHFNIANRTIRGFNGAVALSCPIPLDLEVSPRADVFVKAIEACKGATQLSLTEDKKLFLKSGSFKAYIDCLNEPFPNIFPEGEIVKVGGNMLTAIKKLAPFIAEDASRRWAMGILFRGKSAFSTNNVILIEYWLGFDFPVELNISKQAVQEILRINEEPTHLQISEKSVTFHYSGNRWLRAQNSPTTWPPLDAIFNRENTQIPFPKDFFEALESLSPFTDEQEQIYVEPGKLSTSLAANTGASVDVPEIKATGVYNMKQLRLLEGLAETIDFSLYPAPCLFFGDKLRGALVGIRA